MEYPMCVSGGIAHTYSSALAYGRMDGRRPFLDVPTDLEGYFERERLCEGGGV